jgi:hypothetical protein
MALVKKTIETSGTQVTPQAQVDAVTKGINKESGVDAAVVRLRTPKLIEALSTQKTTTKEYKQRDFDGEARGKTRCALYGQAIASPYLAGLNHKTVEEFIETAKKVAEAGVKYSFGD